METIKLLETLKWVEVERENPTDPRWRCQKCGELLILIPSPYNLFAQCSGCGEMFMQVMPKLGGTNEV